MKRLERWRTIPGWDMYEVSSKGRVKRLAGFTKGNRWIPEHLMKLDTMKDTPKRKRRGRRRVILQQDGRKWSTPKVAQLMLFAFKGPPPTSKHHARHLDDNPSNDKLYNLAWGTHKQNMQDAVRNKVYRYNENSHRAKLTNEQVRKIRRLHAKGTHTYVKLAKKFKVHASTVRHIIKGYNWKYLS